MSWVCGKCRKTIYIPPSRGCPFCDKSTKGKWRKR